MAQSDRDGAPAGSSYRATLQLVRPRRPEDVWHRSATGLRPMDRAVAKSPQQALESLPPARLPIGVLRQRGRKSAQPRIDGNVRRRERDSVHDVGHGRLDAVPLTGEFEDLLADADLDLSRPAAPVTEPAP